MQENSFSKAVGQLRPVVIYAGIMSFFINLLLLPMSLYSLQVYDRVMSTGSVATLAWLTVIMLVIFAAAGLLQTLRGVVLTSSADWLYNAIAENAIPVSLTYAASGEGKNIQSLRDAATIRQFLNGAGLLTLLDAPWAILYIAVLFVIHISLGLLVTCGALLLMALALVTEMATAAASRRAGLAGIRTMEELETATRNADVVGAMGMSGVIVSRWRTSQQSIADGLKLANGRAQVLQGFTKFVRLSLQVLVTALAAWLALDGSVTMGAIIAASILSSRALAPFEAAISGWKASVDARASYSRLQAILASPVRNETIALPTPFGHIAVENIFYAGTTQQKYILRGVNFKLDAGESLGIIGPSGSGKSTLARLLMGTWKPSTGVVRLDGADVYSWPRADFGRHVGYLPQDVELFSGTVRDNIARLLPDAADQDVVKAAQLAGAHDMILRLPEGYSTNIGTGGALLSAGQRQRIGLARAFYGAPRVVMLDEPDSNLDEAGQAAFIQALRLAKAERITFMVVTHRKPILAHVDKILFMRDGVGEIFGPAADVIAHLASQQPRGMETAS